MKKTLLVSLLSLAAAGAYAQGTVTFYNHVVNTVVTHIYSPQLDGTAQSGNAANDFPVGSTVYTGQLLGGASTGATSPTDYSNGTLWTAQLYAAPGINAAVSSLLPVSQYVSTFKTTAGGVGLFSQATPSPDNGIPGTAAGSATVAVAAWYNAGGTITSLAAAQSAGVPAGESPAFNLTALGEPASITGGVASTPENLVGLQSFSVVQSIPEPGTIALGVMGLSALLIRRRK